MATNNPKKTYQQKKCSFIGCNKSRNNFPNLHMFRFPIKRPSICKEWVVNCANESLLDLPDKTLYGKLVCENHFTEDSFLSNMKNSLKKTAIPTLISSAHEKQPVQIEQPSCSNEVVAQDSITLESPFNETPPNSGSLDTATNSRKSTVCRKALFVTSTPETPKYKKFKSVKDRKPTPKKVITPKRKKLINKLKKIKVLQRKNLQKMKRQAKIKPNITKEMIIHALNDLLPPKVSKFVALQIQHASNSKTPWTEEERRQVLTIRYKSPVLYDQLKSEGFALPSRSTIGRWLKNIDLRPGVCPDILNFLKTKIECMSVWEKKAVIMFDEMAIQKSLDFDPRNDNVEGKYKRFYIR